VLVSKSGHFIRLEFGGEHDALPGIVERWKEWKQKRGAEAPHEKFNTTIF
jgi:hypothetical protein